MFICCTDGIKEQKGFAQKAVLPIFSLVYCNIIYSMYAISKSSSSERESVALSIFYSNAYNYDVTTVSFSNITMQES